MKYRKDKPTTFNFLHLNKTPNILNLKKTQTNETNEKPKIIKNQTTENPIHTLYKPKP